MHTKRTGHTEFTDKTLEAVKPISLEVPKGDVDMEEADGESSSNQPEGIVVYMVCCVFFSWQWNHPFIILFTKAMFGCLQMLDFFPCLLYMVVQRPKFG